MEISVASDNNIETVLIVAGGEIDSKLLSNTIYAIGDKPSFIIGVDKGIEALAGIVPEPDLLIGDFDSADVDVLEGFESSGNIIRLNPIKDYTDTHMAVLEALKLKPAHMIILGATGRRLDHFLGNVSLLKICLDNNCDADIIDKHNRISLMNAAKPRVLRKDRQYGDYVSLIPFTDVVSGISLTGFRYSLSDASLKKDETLGISNELVKEEGLIRIGSGELLILETKD